MADKSPFAGLATEDVLVAILGELQTLNGRMPMKDGADNMRVSGVVTANVAGSLTSAGTVSTVSTLSNITSLGGLSAAQFVADQMNQAAAGLYNYLQVT